MKNYCQLEHLQIAGDPSNCYETSIGYNEDDQPCTRPLGFSSNHISIQFSTPKSPFYTPPRTRKTPGRHYWSSCSSPVCNCYDIYYPRTPGYISQQVQCSPKLAVPFMTPSMSFKSFKIQDGGNDQFCGYGYPYAVVTPHNTVFTPRQIIQTDNDEEDDDDEEGIESFSLLLGRILNVCQSLPENLRVQLLNLHGLDELKSVDGGLKMSSTTSRGLGGPTEDLALKLKRFKIRTVDIDEEVTEADKK